MGRSGEIVFFALSSVCRDELCWRVLGWFSFLRGEATRLRSKPSSERPGKKQREGALVQCGRGTKHHRWPMALKRKKGNHRASAEGEKKTRTGTADMFSMLLSFSSRGSLMCARGKRKRAAKERERGGGRESAAAAKEEGEDKGKEREFFLREKKTRSHSRESSSLQFFPKEFSIFLFHFPNVHPIDRKQQIDWAKVPTPPVLVSVPT